MGYINGIAKRYPGTDRVPYVKFGRLPKRSDISLRKLTSRSVEKNDWQHPEIFAIVPNGIRYEPPHNDSEVQHPGSD